ncbi:MAG TPA: hypothetical protein VM889_02320 [Candidatus Thermoplasmatota archaeon]|nr:hypothetical protein [Candidatus Thermoplasmatota archaeon]
MEWSSVAPGAFVVLDVVSLALAGAVALFFWRTHRLVPDAGYAVLASAFAVLGLSYLTIGASEFDLIDPGAAIVDAARVGGQFLGVALIFLNYASRFFNLDRRFLTVASRALAAVAVVYLVIYVAPPAFELPDPRSYLGTLRFLEFMLLAAAAGLVAVGVSGRRFADFAVPAAFLLLAVSKYTWAMIAWFGVDDAVPLPYLWRLAALGILLVVVARAGGGPRAEA